jgi:DNA-binding transcriptional MerR regulator
MGSAGLTIAEVAERTGLTPHTLRYYERDGLMLDVGRAGSGHRRYSERDLGWIELITKLRATGMPIRTVRRYAELVRAGDGNEDERLALLRAHRDQVRADLDTMAAHLDAIDQKISYYAGTAGECVSPDSYLSSRRPASASAPR